MSWGTYLKELNFGGGLGRVVGGAMNIGKQVYSAAKELVAAKPGQTFGSRVKTGVAALNRGADWLAATKKYAADTPWGGAIKPIERMGGEQRALRDERAPSPGRKKKSRHGSPSSSRFSRFG
jgi:hypothetical protein